MIRKRGGWLAVLFLGEMLTASAMGYFEKEIARAVVLALFIPLIISRGGNSGSQATTLVIRAMALGEIRLRDWWRVVWREVVVGLGLGVVLAVIGFLRIVIWDGLFHTYGPQYLIVGATVACSLVGVVLFGTLAGSMLPFVLRRLGSTPPAPRRPSSPRWSTSAASSSTSPSRQHPAPRHALIAPRQSLVLAMRGGSRGRSPAPCCVSLRSPLRVARGFARSRRWHRAFGASATPRPLKLAPASPPRLCLVAEFGRRQTARFHESPRVSCATLGP